MNIIISQAEATGLPVIATKHSGFPEQVIENQNGFLVSEGDCRAIADKIIYLIENPEIWSNLSQKAREHVFLHYDKNLLIKKQIDLYSKAIE
ncbi:MAG: glycosyltransferase [Candidatus Paceibacterota bacterium]|jgi:colanic acid/amylovoran biosynthesis glycosyltransferase